MRSTKPVKLAALALAGWLLAAGLEHLVKASGFVFVISTWHMAIPEPLRASCIPKGGAGGVYGDGAGVRIGAPIPVDPNTTGLTFAVFTINQATDAVEGAFQCIEPDTVTQLGFRYNGRLGTPVQHQVAFQGVNGSGNPDGVIKGGGSPASGTFTPPAGAGWDQTWQWVTLANSYACSRGELLSEVITPVGVPDAGNASQFSPTMSTSVNSNGIPYAIQNDNGTRTRQANMYLFGYKSAAKSYGRPIASAVMQAFSVDSTPDEYGLRFQLGNAGVGGGYQVMGFRSWSAGPAAAKTIKCALYNGTTELQNFTWDSDMVKQAGTDNEGVELYFDEAALTTLDFGSPYRLACAPQEAASGYKLEVLTLPDANAQTAFPGGAQFYLSTRTDSGAWTDDQTKRPMIDLIVRTP